VCNISCVNEFPTMTNLGGFNALIILRAGGNRGDSMEPPNRRGVGVLGRILREGTEGLFLTNFTQKGFGYKTVLQTAKQEAGFFGEEKWAWQPNWFEPTPLQMYKKRLKGTCN